MKEINLYNKKILELWRDSILPKKGWGKLFPMFYDGKWFEKFNNAENRILIVGCNPSFNVGKRDKWALEAFAKLKSFQSTYIAPGKSNNKNAIRKSIQATHAFKPKVLAVEQKKILDLQAAALGLRKDQGVEPHPYFKTIIEFILHLKSKFLQNLISNQITCFTWAHIDLLAMRATNQKEIERFCKRAFDSNIKNLTAIQKKQKEKDGEFIRKQVELFLILVSALKPTLIIVASAYASSLLQEHFGDIFEIQPYDPKQNFYAQEVRFKNFHSHVIFSSMFSGGHMTGGIRDLLAWNVGSFLQHKTSSASSKITTSPVSNPRRRR